MRFTSSTDIVFAAIAVLGLALSIIANFASSATRVPTFIAIGLTAATVSAWIVFAFVRRSFVLQGYDNVMRYLENLAKSARHSVWTARTHEGEAEREEKYFEILCSRVSDPISPLTDFRRIMRLSRDQEPRRHAWWLFERLSRHAGAQIRYFTKGGPKFDFLVVDGRIAVIGLPMPGGLGNMCAVVLRHRPAVRGVEAVFESLWLECKPLFEGSSVATQEEQQEARAKFELVMRKFASAHSVPDLPHDRVW